MKQTLQKLSMLLLMMVIGMGSSWAQSDYSKVYDSNVTLSTEGGTKVTASTVKINETGYTALKAGTGSVAGVVVLNVPANTKYLHLHIAAWNNENVSVSITPADILEATTLTLTANSDISGNTNIYTFNSDATSEDYYKVVTFTGPLAEATTLTLSVTSGKRFVIWGVNAEEDGDIVINKQYPTYNVSGLESVTTNGEFPFNVETRASGLKVELEKTELAELIPGKVVGEYTLKTYGSEGDIILNISTEGDATYYANEEPYNVHISFSQGGEEPQPTYNTVTWTLQYDQSSVSDDYAEWTHKDVKLTYEKNQSNTPVSQAVGEDYGHTRFYANTKVSIVPSDGVEIAYVTFTTLGGKNVSADQTAENASIEIDGTAVKLTPKDGTKAITLVMANQVRAKDMTVYYTGEGTVPVEPTEVTINVMNEDGTPMDEKIVMNVGETKNFKLSASNQAHVSYRGDNDEVATVEPAATTSDGGIITAKAAGTMTITFTVDATSNQPSAEKKISVTVVEPQQSDLAGLTAETAFTVEEAIAAIKAGVDANTDYYVKGLISKVDEIATEQYFNATYWLADDMGADNQMLEIYRGMAFRGDGFNEGNASLVTVGNEVVVKGKLTYYEKSDVYEFKAYSQLVSVKFDFLTVKSGDYGTICLPYDATVEGATVYEVTGVVKDDADNLSDLVLTEHEGNLLAGVPYVYKATADNIAVTYLASAIVTYGYGATGLQGTLAETPLRVKAGNYILYNNVLRKVGDDADAKIAQYHAYFDLTNVATFNPENTADVKYISISFEEDATGITELTEKTEATEGAIYNLQGQRVNSLQRGINIVGGKKVLVK